MTENIANTPYIIQINEPLQTIHLSKDLNNLGIQIDSNTQELTPVNAFNNSQIIVESTEPINILQDTESFSQNFGVIKQEEQPCIFQIVYPEELCLSPAQNIAKRGRPKKKRQEEIEETNLITCKQNPDIDPPRTARTRSGRLVKLPKYIEKDFKKIEITTEEQEVQVSDFKRFEEKENSKIEFAELQTKKRVISSQYKCPKCSKAYLGKNKMIQHLKKYPDHGPLPEGYQQFNFDVWNYLFDITQKCKSGQRGIKFCEELSNLLHNVQLLKSALFKTVTDNKNCVHIDKVLGNAIGLPPGKYKFDENELYKDVTVLKLITNSDFFKPHVNNKSYDNMVAKLKNTDNTHREHCESKKLKQDNQHANVSLEPDENNPQNEINITTVSSDVDIKSIKSDGNEYPFTSKSDQNVNPTVNIEENVVTDTFAKKMDVDNQMLSSDLLTENLLLQSLPSNHPRNSVEDLILTSVDNGSNLLDNSTSSDEVMNVDQFVNERFKKIIGPDVELSNASLNLDLPSLELFHFHTS